jgi:hypothetical protein
MIQVLSDPEQVIESLKHKGSTLLNEMRCDMKSINEPSLISYQELDRSPQDHEKSANWKDSRQSVGQAYVKHNLSWYLDALVVAGPFLLCRLEACK